MFGKKKKVSKMDADKGDTDKGKNDAEAGSSGATNTRDQLGKLLRDHRGYLYDLDDEDLLASDPRDLQDTKMDSDESFYRKRRNLEFSMMMMGRYYDPFQGHRMWGKHYRHGEELDEHTLQQLRWAPPVMVEPEAFEDEKLLGIEDHGDVVTDAALYILKEKKDGEVKIHSMLQMPSNIPELLEGTNKDYYETNTFNILMADVSCSMYCYWKPLVNSWNEHIAPCLVGRTNLYTFGSKVTFKRSGTILEFRDMDGSSTDLTGSLQTIVDEVYKCKERYVNVFLVTDGHHNSTEVKPTKVIYQMNAAKGKTCDVFVLGAGTDFPVQYSINIRSRLHNGRANLPSLFWAKSEDDVPEQIKQIASIISERSSRCIELSLPGYYLPDGVQKNFFHLREWVYFPSGPEALQRLALKFGRHICHISLEPREMRLSILNDVFRQWNSVIIQNQNKKERVPLGVLPFMECLFNTQIDAMKDLKSGTVKERLSRKEFKMYETDFRTLFNKIRDILTTFKYKNELELAENILSTTVGGGKYEVKALQLKGHTDEDFAKDYEDFLKIYEEHKPRILTINNTTEDCCRFTHSSTVSDLQDPDFSTMMSRSKYEFLKDFTISGIPVYAPSKDTVIINPWSFSVRSLLDEPYTVMSQVALESIADQNPPDTSQEMQVKQDDILTRCNAIIPVFSPTAAKIMQPVVNTRLYSVCATYAILKNPHIIDFNIHMAALGVTWVRILYEYPTIPRPEFVRRRIESIEATAALYLGRSSYTKYWQLLKSDAAQALMTESTIKVDNKTLKCETLIKPMFVLHMYQRSENHEDAGVVANIMRMILLEYIGRCLSHYKKNDRQATPFTDFFAYTLADQKLKREWVQNYIVEAKEKITGCESYLLENFYTLELARKAAKKSAIEEIKNLKKELTALIPIVVEMKEVERLRNPSLAGDLSWFTLKTFAREVGLKQEVIDDLFSERSVFVFTAHALRNRSSRERLSTPMGDYDENYALVTKSVQEENYRIIAKELIGKIINQLEDVWLIAHGDAHGEVVQPMTRQLILAEAQKRAVDVTDDTFDKVYKKYRPDVGLLSNACQCRACPYFLIPNKRYNQHSSVERRQTSMFPHGLHRAAYNHRESDLPTLISSLESGSFKTPVPRQAVEPFTEDLENLQRLYHEENSTGP
ncbi:uncharacterized protein [Cherax quadricarinatus]